jgi:S1-C subfamily serine protease
VGSIGIGFAIPINAARSFLEEIRQHGQVRRPWTGILSLQNLTPLLAEYLALSSTEGALVVKIIVDVDSPAYLAGLEEGDVIVAIDAEKVRGADEGVRFLQRYRVDEECTLTVARNGGIETIRMRFGERPRSRRRW